MEFVLVLLLVLVIQSSSAKKWRPEEVNE